MTWPLAQGIARDVPGDLGDSLLNLWILGWGAEHLPRLVTGEMTVAEFRNANIFHPEPLAIAFSEHLFGQVLQILPVYHTTGNLILAYNLLFISSFALSGLGMYLLVRDVLGPGPASARAAFIAGLIYAFVPLRIAQVAHIQSLSSQWMPLALYGFRRFIAQPPTGRDARGRVSLWPLVGGSAALLMQNWSSGYYLIFFAPVVLIFVAHQIVSLGRTRDRRVWMAFAAAGGVVFAGTWPFLALYLDAQRVHGFERPLGEVIRYSADVFSYLTAPEALRSWGSVWRAYPKAEGELFFGCVPVTLAIIGVAVASGRALRSAPPTRPGSRLVRIAIPVLAALVATQVFALAAILVTGGFVTSFTGVTIRATNALRALTGAALATAALLSLSRRARQAGLRIALSPAGLSLGSLLLTMWLSAGPVVQSRGQAIPGLGLYNVLYEHVPGFDGLRVPARYSMVAAIFLSVLSGYGAAALLARMSRPVAGAFVIGALVIGELAFAPMPVNLSWGDRATVPPARIEPAASAPAVYRALAALPDPHVVTELPFGDPAWELRYVYYSTVHWKRLVNGYSGAFPQSYTARVARLQRISEAPEEAWRALLDSGTTLVVVHRGAYAGDEDDVVERWLSARGASERGRFGQDVLFELPR